jgi:hypothetical protein
VVKAGGVCVVEVAVWAFAAALRDSRLLLVASIMALELLRRREAGVILLFEALAA